MPARGKGATYQGYKWCHPPTRYAIYWRDRCQRTQQLRCVWCNRKAPVADVIKGSFRLSLDHLDPWSKGGTNHPTNLVTACLSCNARRGAQSYEETALAGTFPWHAFRRIEKTCNEPLDRVKGKDLAGSVWRPWRKPAVLFERDPAVDYGTYEAHPDDAHEYDPNDLCPF
jgi:hypothetical protein